MRFPLQHTRKKLITWLFHWTMIGYCKFKQKAAWGITTAQLLYLPSQSLGHHLGQLLHKNGFELLPKVERHDAYHLVTGYGTAVEEEIALQYCCFGNGKRTPYLYGVLLLGTFILPDYMSMYLKAYRLGHEANSFHHFDYKKLLSVNFEHFRSTIFNRSQVSFIKQ
jgi:ubiquinone biosynthesis protein Coq4